MRASDAKATVGGARASLYRHGGRLAAAARAFPSAPLPWIDLSTGVNPHPWRGRMSGGSDAARLPDPAATARLEAAAAAAFGCRPGRVAAVPGADAALRFLPRLLPARTVAIAAPTYDGHGDAWRAAGVRVREIGRAALPAADADVVVVVNPNNPDGACTPRRALLALAARQRARGGWLIVDESFAEASFPAVPGHSVASAAGRGLVVLRSFGKFYGLPGLRLGFVAADRRTLADVRVLTGDWPATSHAVAAGTAAYMDEPWRTRARDRLARDAARLDRLLLRHGFEIVGGTGLFRLAAHPDARRVFLALARAGILVRPFDHAPRWLRFGIPPARAWTRLRRALESCSRRPRP